MPEDQQPNEQPQGDPPPEPKAPEQKQPETPKAGDDNPWADPAAAEKEIRKLRDENAKRRTWQRDNEGRLGDYDKLLESQKTEDQKRQDQLESVSQTNVTLTKALARSQVMLRAVDAFADPSDAADALDLASFVGEDGDVDMSAVDTALKELLTRKPHWAKQGEQSKGPRPDPSQGRKGSANGNIEQQIEAALKDGDVNRAMSLRNGQLFESIRTQRTH